MKQTPELVFNLEQETTETLELIRRFLHTAIRDEGLEVSMETVEEELTYLESLIAGSFGYRGTYIYNPEIKKLQRKVVSRNGDPKQKKVLIIEQALEDGYSQRDFYAIKPEQLPIFERGRVILQEIWASGKPPNPTIVEYPIEQGGEEGDFSSHQLVRERLEALLENNPISK